MIWANRANLYMNLGRESLGKFWANLFYAKIKNVNPKLKFLC